MDTKTVNGPQIVCCVCGKPCSIYSPMCFKCSQEMLDYTAYRRTPEQAE